ncbi:MAG: hypothetical protein LUQ26_07960 [Methylococcaceae bacterium]|nr:hypothetical protein [Methylococcaceae bacterium]
MNKLAWQKWFATKLICGGLKVVFIETVQRIKVKMSAQYHGYPVLSQMPGERTNYNKRTAE